MVSLERPVTEKNMEAPSSRVQKTYYSSKEPRELFRNFLLFLAIFFYIFVYFGQNGCTYCFITIFFGIFASNNRKNYPKFNIWLVKYQIFLLFIKIFLGTRFLGSYENLDSSWKFGPKYNGNSWDIQYLFREGVKNILREGPSFLVGV